jgi:flagellar biogenesis protein FliO
MQFVTTQDREHTIPSHVINSIEVVMLSSNEYSVIIYADDAQYLMGVYDEKVKADFEVSNMVDNINRDCNYAFMKCD